jgi:hypothetical protein
MTSTPRVTVVYSGPAGFVTDLGGPLELRDTTTGTVHKVPRYGVWKHDGHKPQVARTTDDLATAIADASQEHKS